MAFWTLGSLRNIIYALAGVSRPRQNQDFKPKTMERNGAKN